MTSRKAMMGMGAVITLAGILASDAPSALAWNGGCDTGQVIQGGTVVNRFQTTGLGCVVNVTPVEKSKLIYREYWFDERGRFLVVSSVEGPPELAVGSRTYFLFPRKQNPDFQILNNGDISVTLVSGEKMSFSSETSRTLDYSAGRLVEDPAVDLYNEGGLEITKGKGLLLDCGWQINHTAYSNFARDSTFIDGAGKRCRVKNKEIFSMTNTYYDEPNWIYPTDAGLKGFLAERCPGLDLSSLGSPAAK